MIIPVSASLRRLVMCGMLLVAPGAMGQTTTTATPPTATKAKPTPVIRPHGALQPRKPSQKPPVKPSSKAPAPPAAPAAPPPAPAPAPAPTEQPKQTEADIVKGSSTGLPLPRFAALRSDEVNLRAGPGTRYPTEWIYQRRELPVEILREFEVWRLVQDPDGIKGWVHQATLTGRRSFIVSGGDSTMRHDAQDNGRSVAILKPGVIGHLRSCQANSDWCQVQVGDYRGYLKRSQFWGTLPGEVVAGG